MVYSSDLLPSCYSSKTMPSSDKEQRSNTYRRRTSSTTKNSTAASSRADTRSSHTGAAELLAVIDAVLEESASCPLLNFGVSQRSSTTFALQQPRNERYPLKRSSSESDVDRVRFERTGIRPLTPMSVSSPIKIANLDFIGRRVTLTNSKSLSFRGEDDTKSLC